MPTASAADDRDAPSGFVRSIEASTATLDEVTTLLADPIERFRAAAPLGAISATNLAAIIDDLHRWARSHGRVVGTLSDVAAGVASVSVRIDVDMAIADSPALAETVLGPVAATWSVLHTAGYAGYWYGQTWYRHVAVASLYRRLAQHGELALHVDPFGLVAATDLDPRFAIRSELDWLRDVSGGPVRGVSAHDAAPVHGAENFEIFDRWALAVPTIKRDARYARLAGTLDAAEVGVEWCAGSPRPGTGGADAVAYLCTPPPWPLQDQAWMRSYLHDGSYCRWFDGCDIWLIGDDRWALSDRINDRFLHGVSWEAAREVLSNLDVDTDVSVCLHPVYVTGLR